MLRPWRAELVAIVAAAYLGIVLNGAFWRKFIGIVSPQDFASWAFVASAVLAVVGVYYLVLILFSLKPLLRILLALLLPATAAASYFMTEYGVVIDQNMIRNVIETDPREAGDLMTMKLVLWVATLGVLPAILLCVVPWSEGGFRSEVWRKAKYTLPIVVGLALVIYPFFGDYISLVREHRELKQTLAPLNYLTSLAAYVGRKTRSGPQTVTAFGTDARDTAPAGKGERKRLFVVVVGETARADHFALNGYARPTNPQLAKIAGIVNFPLAYSCGTDTAQSVPCMFSGLTRENFSNEAAASRENVLDVLKRAGVDILWRDNQAGCKGVCERVQTETLTGLRHPVFYLRSENMDEILVSGLDERIAKLDRDTVIVLHMMGSHGPAYWKRYPDKFEVFTPACKDAQFSRCTRDEIINAYDNTIVYTDHVLATLIEKLSRAAEHGVDAGMIYMSDHGESLGEGNVYLHGMPYALAPEAQIHIPMLLWLAPSLRGKVAADPACMTSRAATKVGHDNLFHSLLGVMQISTSIYDPALDLFATCRRPAS